MLNLVNLLDDAKCYETVRQLRWPEGVRCPKCGCDLITKRGKDDTQAHRQRYCCQGCGSQFDDLTGTIFSGRRQPLRIWISCLYLMGLNVSNRQIAQELDLDKDDVHQMTTQLRQAIVDRKPEVQLSGEVECDEVYITAGHKGNPDAVKKKAAKGVRANSKGFGDAGRSQRKSRRS